MYDFTLISLIRSYAVVYSIWTPEPTSQAKRSGIGSGVQIVVYSDYKK